MGRRTSGDCIAARRPWTELAVGRTATEHLLQTLARQSEPLGGAGLRAALAQRVLDHPPLELLDGVVEGLRRGRPAAGVADALGELLETDGLARVGEGHRSLDLILQLAYVARERVRPEASQGLRLDRRDRAPGPLAVHAQEV